jgi:ribosomal protein S12 methylthiotransferase
MKTRSKQNSINIVTLGCSKNLVDSEQLMKQLDAGGLKVMHDADVDAARTVVINTCGFIGDAKQESINTILQYVDAKQEGLIDRVYVMGCLSERYKKELLLEIPEVDAMFGVNNLADIVEKLGVNYKKDLLGERVLSTPKHYAYLKISEGCDRICSFCAIPLIRGKHVSKTIDDIISETRVIVKNGVKEIMLIAQDLTYYGVDIYKRQSLAELLQYLSDIDGLEWIRLHYAYPASFPTEVLKIMRERENICKYLDIPFQHISDNVLRNMRRGVNSSQTYDLIKKLRDEVPGLTLRSTLLVGHPGEGEKEFEELIRFVSEVKFDRLGVFTYSEEEDTYAASTFKDSLSPSAKQKRADSIMKLQQGISEEKNAEKINSTIKVIIDRKEGDYWIGRSEGDSPEVDNEVLVSTNKKLNIGEFYQVKVTSADLFDLFARY